MIGVMKRRLMYVELKSGYNDDGPAFIGWVTFSKTRKTVKVHGKNLERFQGGKANHFDTANDDLYWVSAPKKNRNDRHELGRHASVHIDDDAREEYERIMTLES